jgi:ABC-type multidrug transport system permease subunit
VLLNVQNLNFSKTFCFNFSSFGFLLIIPFICLVSFYLIIGTDPKLLKLAIVNHEISNFSECSDPVLQTTTIRDYNCYVNKVSCRFLNRLNDSIATKHFYHSFDDAYEDVRHGKLNGLIQFSANFTTSLRPLNEWKDFMKNHTDNGEIQIYLDQSDRQITFFLKQKLFDVFEEFIGSLMEDCGKSRRVGSTPIRIETVYGSLKDEMQRSMLPGIIVTIYFFLASMITSTAFISDRLDGVWNRILLAGVDPIEVFMSHIIFSSFVVGLQTVEFVIVTTYFFELENLGNYWLVMTLIVLVGLSAILYGIAVSILSNDYMTATFSSTLIFYPMMIMCGIFWPLEAIPWFFRYLAYCLPFTLPTVALRNILYKGYGLANLSVQVGFSVIVLWILVALLICFIGLKSKKFFSC